MAFPNPKQKTDRELLIERLRDEIKKQEQHGQFDTVHHSMLKQLLGTEKAAQPPKPKTEPDEETKE